MWRRYVFIRHICSEQKMLLNIADLTGINNPHLPSKKGFNWLSTGWILLRLKRNLQFFIRPLNHQFALFF